MSKSIDFIANKSIISKTGGAAAMEFEYEIINGAACITAYKGRAEQLVLPEEIEGVPVLSIGKNAFNGNRHIKKVEMGKNVRRIEANAFFYCTELRELKLNQGLEYIGDFAFHKCPIANVLLPKSLKEIGLKCFHAMENYDDFRQDISVEQDNEHIFTDGHALYTVNGDELCLFAVFSADIKAFRSFSHDVRYELQPGCTRIKSRSFANCRNLKAVTLPDSLKVIEDEAFMECISISEIKLPHNLKEIGRDAFLNTNIASFSLPSSIEYIGEGAFAVREQWNERRYAKKLSMSEDNSAYSISDNKLVENKERLLADYASDDVIFIPSGIKEICSKAYHHNIAREIHIPSSVKSIHKDAFLKCNHLKRLYMDFLGERGCLYMPGAKADYDVKPVHEQCVACIHDTEDGWLFDFESYDCLFPSVSDKREKILMAANRLKFAVRLEEKYRLNYLQYLNRHAKDAVKTVVEFDELESLSALAELGLFTQSNIDELIELANRANKPELLSYLMNYKNSHIGISEEDYEL